MFKTIIILVLIVIIISGIGFSIYFLYEKPVEESSENILVKLNIRAIDSDLNSIVTGYNISNGNLFNNRLSGTTLKNGFIQRQSVSNSTIYVFNRNIEGQEYYSDIIKLNTTDIKPKRITLTLINSGNISFFQEGKIINKDLNLTLKSDGIFKEPIFCLKWSSNFIKVNTNNSYSKIDIPKELRKYDKCFETNKDITKNTPMVIPIKLILFNKLGKRDYLKLILVDKDKITGLRVWNNKTYNFS